MTAAPVNSSNEANSIHKPRELANASVFIGDLYPVDQTIFLVFGYGSLLWKQGFEFTAEYNVFVRGYERLFYQGTPDHRGTVEDPGRVVTLLPRPSSGPSYRVDGKAFQLPTDPKVVRGILEYLDARETGYERYEIELLDFDKSKEQLCDAPLDIFSHPNAPEENHSEAAKKKKVVSLLYLATEANEEYLGPASMEDMAENIIRCSGPSGSNMEYLDLLVQSLRKMGAHDQHVFDLFDTTQRILSERKISHGGSAVPPHALIHHTTIREGHGPGKETFAEASSESSAYCVGSRAASGVSKRDALVEECQSSLQYRLIRLQLLQNTHSPHRSQVGRVGNNGNDRKGVQAEARNHPNGPCRVANGEERDSHHPIPSCRAITHHHHNNNNATVMPNAAGPITVPSLIWRMPTLHTRLQEIRDRQQRQRRWIERPPHHRHPLLVSSSVRGHPSATGANDAEQLKQVLRSSSSQQHEQESGGGGPRQQSASNPEGGVSAFFFGSQGDQTLSTWRHHSTCSHVSSSSSMLTTPSFSVKSAESAGPPPTGPHTPTHSRMHVDATLPSGESPRGVSCGMTADRDYDPVAQPTFSQAGAGHPGDGGDVGTPGRNRVKDHTKTPLTKRSPRTESTEMMDKWSRLLGVNFRAEWDAIEGREWPPYPTYLFDSHITAQRWCRRRHGIRHVPPASPPQSADKDRAAEQRSCRENGVLPSTSNKPSSTNATPVAAVQVTFSPSGDAFLVGFADGLIWYVQNVERLRAHQAPVMSSYLGNVVQNRWSRRMDPSGACRHRSPSECEGKAEGVGKSGGEEVLFGHTERITCFAFSDSGAEFASASMDGSMILWRTATRSKLRRIVLTDPYASSSSHQALHRSDGSASHLSAENEAPVHHQHRFPQFVLFAPHNNNYCLVSCYGESQLLLYNISTGLPATTSVNTALPSLHMNGMLGSSPITAIGANASLVPFVVTGSQNGVLSLWSAFQFADRGMPVVPPLLVPPGSSPLTDHYYDDHPHHEGGNSSRKDGRDEGGTYSNISNLSANATRTSSSSSSTTPIPASSAPRAHHPATFYAAMNEMRLPQLRRVSTLSLPEGPGGVGAGSGGGSSSCTRAGLKEQDPPAEDPTLKPLDGRREKGKQAGGRGRTCAVGLSVGSIEITGMSPSQAHTILREVHSSHTATGVPSSSSLVSGRCEKDSAKKTSSSWWASTIFSALSWGDTMTGGPTQPAGSTSGRDAPSKKALPPTAGRPPQDGVSATTLISPSALRGLLIIVANQRGTIHFVGVTLDERNTVSPSAFPHGNNCHYHHKTAAAAAASACSYCLVLLRSCPHPALKPGADGFFLSHVGPYGDASSPLLPESCALGNQDGAAVEPPTEQKKETFVSPVARLVSTIVVARDNNRLVTLACAGPGAIHIVTPLRAYDRGYQEQGDNASRPCRDRNGQQKTSPHQNTVVGVFGAGHGASASESSSQVSLGTREKRRATWCQLTSSTAFRSISSWQHHSVLAFPTSPYHFSQPTLGSTWKSNSNGLTNNDNHQMGGLPTPPSHSDAEEHIHGTADIADSRLEWCTSLCWSPDAQYLVAATSLGEVYLWPRIHLPHEADDDSEAALSLPHSPVVLASAGIPNNASGPMRSRKDEEDSYHNMDGDTLALRWEHSMRERQYADPTPTRGAVPQVLRQQLQDHNSAAPSLPGNNNTIFPRVGATMALGVDYTWELLDASFCRDAAAAARRDGGERMRRRGAEGEENQNRKITQVRRNGVRAAGGGSGIRHSWDSLSLSSSDLASTATLSVCSRSR